WRSGHYEAPDWAVRASRTSAASSSRPGSALPTCVRAGTSSRSRWRPRPRCRRCGSARGAARRRWPVTASGLSRRSRSRLAPTGTCCSSGGRSRSSRRSSPSGSSCCVAARSVPPTCTAGPARRPSRP
ncbi:MAG: FIG00820327: hypothetical protein, partial [uncultured Nocardioidaceae bacterium]